MESQYKLNLPESHLNILRLVSAMVWADGNLSEEELLVLLKFIIILAVSCLY